MRVSWLSYFSLATLYTSAACGYDDLPRELQQTAVGATLANYYAVVSVGSRRATASSLRRAALRICALSSTSAQPARRRQGHHFRGRAATQTQLLTRVLPVQPGVRVR